MCCVARSAVEVSIPITNPLQEELLLDVSYSHDSLIGPAKCHMQPAESRLFLFYFAPLAAGTTRGHLRLQSPALGAFWYEIDMDGQPAGAVQVSHIQGAVGSTSEANFTFVNPLPKALTFQLCMTGSDAFRALESEVRLGALEAHDLKINYRPQSLDRKEEAQLTVHNSVRPQSNAFSSCGC
jgi:hypothetical protein